MIELFRNRSLQALRDGKHVSPSRLAALLSWKHSGFHIDGGSEKPVPAHDTDGRKRLAEYLLRHPFSLQKITWNATTQTVIYRSKLHHTTKRNFEIFKATDFLAAVIDHVPPKFKHTVRYYGEPDLSWFNQPRKPSELDPEWFDQTSTWKAPEVPLNDGRILVLEYT